MAFGRSGSMACFRRCSQLVTRYLSLVIRHSSLLFLCAKIHISCITDKHNSHYIDVSLVQAKANSEVVPKFAFVSEKCDDLEVYARTDEQFTLALDGMVGVSAFNALTNNGKRRFGKDLHAGRNLVGGLHANVDTCAPARTAFIAVQIQQRLAGGNFRCLGA